MDRLEQIRDLGRSLGYEEAELREFVTERERIERQVRFEEREDKRLADERETQRLADERETQRLADERETQRLVLEAEREDKRLADERETQRLADERETQRLVLEAEREDKRIADERETQRLADEMEFRKEEMKLKFDLEISRNQLESERMRSTVNHNVGYSNQDVGSFQMPTLPYFVDGKDNIDSYLARFETYAHSMNWPLERYSLCLSSLLTGKALDVLAKIPQSLVHDYEHLKNTLLAEYQLASGDFMKRFFTSRQSGNESATQLMGRLEHYLGRWISLSGTDESFAGLKELFLKEQFLHACPRDLAIFLREQAPGDLPMMMSLAARFASAHSSSITYEKADERPNINHSGNSSANRFKQNANKTNLRPVLKCYLCNQPGHFISNCPQGRPVGNHSPSLVEDGSHVAGNAAIMVDEPDHQCSIALSGAELKCGCRVPVRGNLCVEEGKQLPMMEGFVGKHCVGILRDTGCSGVIVRRSLVEPSEFTGKKRTLMMVDKSLIQVPTAICIVNCPVFSGRVEALCLEDPVCDVIIGNVPGALLVGESQVAKCILGKETWCSHNALLYSPADTRIGEKPFTCNICRKHFSRRSYLQRHKHTHTGEKPFECDVCKKRFTRQHYLQRHKHSHTGEKLVKGVTCRATYSRSVGVPSHVCTQRGENELTHDTCEAQKSQIRTHTGENPHKRDTSGLSHIRSLGVATV